MKKMFKDNAAASTEQVATSRTDGEVIPATPAPAINDMFVDARELYLEHIRNTLEKLKSLRALYPELVKLKPNRDFISIADFGTGDGFLSSGVAHFLHRNKDEKLAHVIGGKEFSDIDAELTLQKWAGNLAEHPNTLCTLNNYAFEDASQLTQTKLLHKPAKRLVIKVKGRTEAEIARELKSYSDQIKDMWQTTKGSKGQDISANRAALIIYREDQEEKLKHLIPAEGEPLGFKHDVTIISQAWQALAAEEAKAGIVASGIIGTRVGGFVAGIHTTGESDLGIIAEKLLGKDPSQIFPHRFESIFSLAAATANERLDTDSRRALDVMCRGFEYEFSKPVTEQDPNASAFIKALTQEVFYTTMPRRSEIAEAVHDGRHVPIISNFTTRLGRPPRIRNELGVGWILPAN